MTPLIFIVPETAVMWACDVEFFRLVQQAGFNPRYYSRIGKKVIESYVWNIIFWISTLP